jgi:hypothetical protein
VQATKTSSSKRMRHDVVVDPTKELCPPHRVQSGPFTVVPEFKMGVVDGKWQNATDHLLLGLPGPHMMKPFTPLCQFDRYHSLELTIAMRNCLDTPFDAHLSNGLLNLSDTRDVLEHLNKANKLLEDGQNDDDDDDASFNIKFHIENSSGKDASIPDENFLADLELVLGSLSDRRDVLQHLKNANKLPEDEQNDNDDDTISSINFIIENSPRDDIFIPDENFLPDVDLDDFDNFHTCFQDNKREESSFSERLLGDM